MYAIVKKWTDTKEHCKSQVHCKSCRTKPAFVESIRRSFEFNGICPHGFTADTVPTIKQVPTAFDFTKYDLAREQAALKRMKEYGVKDCEFKRQQQLVDMLIERKGK